MWRPMQGRQRMRYGVGIVDILSVIVGNLSAQQAHPFRELILSYNVNFRGSSSHYQFSLLATAAHHIVPIINNHYRSLLHHAKTTP